MTSAVLQLGWGALVLRRPARQLILAGAMGNAAVVALWSLTRVIGLPLGPEGAGGGRLRGPGRDHLLSAARRRMPAVARPGGATPARAPDTYWIAVGMVAAGVLALTIQGVVIGGA